MTGGLRARLLTAAGLLVAPLTYTVGTQFVGGTLERGVIKRGPAIPRVAHVGESPAVARAIASGGHDLANHTYSHHHLWTLGPRASREEVDRGAAAIANATS